MCTKKETNINIRSFVDTKFSIIEMEVYFKYELKKIVGHILFWKIQNILQAISSPLMLFYLLAKFHDHAISGYRIKW